MSANGMPPAFQFDTFLTASQNAIGQGAKSDVRLAKRFVWEKLSKKVQFLQPNNDDMMKKVYAMARRYMNYFFVIDNFVKHANAKGYNRHVMTGAMQLSELLSVRQEALGLLLLENYQEPWKQLVEYMKQGKSTVPSNVEPAKAKYTNPGQKKMPWKSEGMERYNQLHEEVRQDQLSSEGQQFDIQFKNKMKQEAGVARSRKRKTIQLVNVAAVHELDDVSSNEDSSQRSRQTRSTYGSSISSRASNPTGV
jgi:hypothetical protein